MFMYIKKHVHLHQILCTCTCTCTATNMYICIKYYMYVHVHQLTCTCACTLFDYLTVFLISSYGTPLARRASYCWMVHTLTITESIWDMLQNSITYLITDSHTCTCTCTCKFMLICWEANPINIKFNMTDLDQEAKDKQETLSLCNEHDNSFDNLIKKYLC